MNLEHRARVQPGSYRAGHSHARQSDRLCVTAVTSEKLCAITGEAVQLVARGQEGDRLAEVLVPRIPCQQRFRLSIEGRDDEPMTGLGGGAQHPLGIVRRRNSPWTIRAVGQFEADDLDGILERNEQSEVVLEVVAAVPE